MKPRAATGASALAVVPIFAPQAVIACTFGGWYPADEPTPVAEFRNHCGTQGRFARHGEKEPERT
jgi:hypothetical protein